MDAVEVHYLLFTLTFITVILVNILNIECQIHFNGLIAVALLISCFHSLVQSYSKCAHRVIITVKEVKKNLLL